MSEERHVAVVGGGITGLAAAHALMRAAKEGNASLKVSLIEADSRLGGKIRTERIAGEAVDVGAESLMIRGEGALALCDELDLVDDLVRPLRMTTSVWTRGRLREMPPGLLSGMPAGTWPLLRSGILSPVGIGRAALDLILPKGERSGDRSVAEVFGARFGSEAVERLFDPLLGTIYAAGCESLSIEATLPHVHLAARQHRSLLRGLRASSGRQSSGAPPSFLTLPGGLGRIVSRLTSQLKDVDVRTGVQAGPLLRSLDGRYLLHLSDGEPMLLDGVLIATPASQAAAVLGVTSPTAARQLRTIQYVSAVVVTLRLHRVQLTDPPGFAGLLVPRREKRMLGALTVLSEKWEHLGRNGDVWLRASVARDSVPRALELEDAELVRHLQADLKDAIGLRYVPLHAHVMRWRSCLPVYSPGHIDRIRTIDEALEALPRVMLAGAAFKGIGVPQCIEQGRAAAQRLLACLESAGDREAISGGAR